MTPAVLFFLFCLETWRFLSDDENDDKDDHGKIKKEMTFSISQQQQLCTRCTYILSTEEAKRKVFINFRRLDKMYTEKLKEM